MTLIPYHHDKNEQISTFVRLSTYLYTGILLFRIITSSQKTSSRLRVFARKTFAPPRLCEKSSFASWRETPPCDFARCRTFSAHISALSHTHRAPPCAIRFRAFSAFFHY